MYKKYHPATVYVEWEKHQKAKEKLASKSKSMSEAVRELQEEIINEE